MISAGKIRRMLFIDAKGKMKTKLRVKRKGYCFLMIYCFLFFPLII